MLCLPVALVVASLLSGCTVPRPEGASPLRYRDQVFSSVTKNADVQYGSASDLQGNPVALKLDLYRPVGDTETQRPAMLFVHGGGFCCGDKSASNVTDLAKTFAKLGYVSASINYRLLAETGCGGSGVTPECTVAALAAQHDAQAAVRWLRANASTYGVDPTRIGIGGTSAGAVTATLVGLNSEDPGDSGNPGYPSKVGGFMSLSGGIPESSVINAGDSPGLLFHGTADTVVPYQWSASTAATMLNAGVAAYLETFDGAGHVPYNTYHDEIVSQTDYFFYDFLDLAHAHGQPGT